MWIVKKNLEATYRISNNKHMLITKVLECNIFFIYDISYLKKIKYIIFSFNKKDDI